MLLCHHTLTSLIEHISGPLKSSQHNTPLKSSQHNTSSTLKEIKVLVLRKEGLL